MKIDIYTTYQNLQDAAKVCTKRKVQEGKCLLKKQERAQINNLTLHSKELGKKKQMKPKVNRRK